MLRKKEVIAQTKSVKRNLTLHLFFFIFSVKKNIERRDIFCAEDDDDDKIILCNCEKSVGFNFPSFIIIMLC